MALALLIFCFHLFAIDAQTPVPLPTSTEKILECDVYNNIQLWGGDFGVVTDPTQQQMNTMATLALCVAECREWPGCVQAVYNRVTNSCLLQKLRFDGGQSASADHDSVICTSVYMQGLLGIHSTNSLPTPRIESDENAFRQRLVDWDSGTFVDTATVAGGDPVPTGTFGTTSATSPAPVVGATTDISDQHFLWALPPVTPVPTPPQGWVSTLANPSSPRLLRVVFRTASSTYDMDGYELIWGRGADTAIGITWAGNRGYLSGASPVNAINSGTPVEFTFPTPLTLTTTTATDTAFFGLRVLSVRDTPATPDQPVTGRSVHIADVIFYVEAAVYVPVSSSAEFSSSSPISSSAPYSSSAGLFSSSSAPAPPPVCTADCLSILRQNCTSSGPCGNCIPGKFGTPAPSNANDCCLDDCASLHRRSCPSSGDYCGECMDGWVPPTTSQAQDIPFRSQACKPLEDINGGWSPWFSCDRACGGGRRFRTCSDPLPQGNGANCIGLDVQNCNLQACPSTQASDPCLRSPPECLNGATCVSWVDTTKPSGYGHTCQCTVGFFGKKCETDAVSKAVGNILKSIQDASAFQRYYFPDARTAASLQWPKPRPGEEWGDNIDRRVSRLEDEGFAGYGSPEELRHWALFHQPGRFGPYPIQKSSTGGLPPLSEVIDRLLYPTSGQRPSSSSAGPPSSSPPSSSSAPYNASSSAATANNVSSSTAPYTSSPPSSSVSSSSGVLVSSSSEVAEVSSSSSSSPEEDSSSSSSSTGANFLLDVRDTSHDVNNINARPSFKSRPHHHRRPHAGSDSSNNNNNNKPNNQAPLQPSTVQQPTPAAVTPTTINDNDNNNNNDNNNDNEYVMQARVNDALQEATEEAAAAVTPTEFLEEAVTTRSTHHNNNNNNQKYSQVTAATDSDSISAAPSSTSNTHYALALLLLLLVSLCMQQV